MAWLYNPSVQFAWSMVAWNLINAGPNPGQNASRSHGHDDSLAVHCPPGLGSNVQRSILGLLSTGSEASD